jgi:anti-sigma factor RsiW
VECRASQRLLDAYVDRELDAAESASVERHIDTCDRCAASQRQIARLGLAARQLRYTMPASLEASIRSSLRAEVQESASVASQRPNPFRFWRTAAAAAACFVAGVSLTGLLIVEHGRPPVTVARGEDLTDQAIDSHVRSLMAGHLVDVESSDQHTVKPWFAGRVTFSPDVRDLAAQGYTLVGGRLDYLAHATVAALVYQYRAHKINAFTWPAGDSDAAEPASEERRGYHVLRWRDGGMMWCLVSDASSATLLELRQLIQSHDPASTQSVR